MKAARVEVDQQGLERILGLYRQGLCLQAYELAQSYGPLRAWSGVEARVVAGRLAAMLGAPPLGQALHYLAWREAPEHPLARIYYARVLLERRGPLALWEFMRGHEELTQAPATLQAEWLALRANVCAQLRDFDLAEELLAKALELTPSYPWIFIERSHLMELEDRYEEALQAARHSLELVPWYRPGVQCAAHLLELLDRDAEALALLEEASARMESAPVTAQLALLQSELCMFAQARESFERYGQLSPLLDSHTGQWLHARRCDMAYYCGDHAAAMENARLTKGEFYQEFAKRLEQRDCSQHARVLLPVGFVRQHHMTCAPATLTALARYWSMPADHLTLAEEICYDGTPGHKQRTWAEQNGWIVREFTVTWDSARTLLDRKIPFTLATVELTSAHLQAVIGYDTLRGTLIVRDPFLRSSSEFVAAKAFEYYRPTGPKGMVLLPKECAAQLHGVSLPEESYYDLVYKIEVALDRHERQAAGEYYAQLTEQAPGHRLSFEARRYLAHYDADLAAQLESTEQLLELFPDSQVLLLSKIRLLQALDRRKECETLLHDICQKPSSHPALWQQYAELLADDAREHEKAIDLLRKILRRMPVDAACYFTLATVYWSQHRYEQAIEFYRFATCLEDKDERLACAYFVASRHLKCTSQAIEFLDKRYRRLGARSSLPVRTLYWAYNQLERTGEALRVLNEGLQRHSQDSELLLFAAEEHALHGKLKRAVQLLEEARSKSRRLSWLRCAARLAEYANDDAQAQAHWQEVLTISPLDVAAHASLALLTERTQGRQAAIEQLRQAGRDFPYSWELHGLLLDWLREDDPEQAEGVVRHLLGLNPVNAWAHRELALILGRLNRLEEAFASIETARSLDPLSSSLHAVWGQLHVQAGNSEQARQAYREAIRLNIDNDCAITELISACTTPAERREALHFIEQQMIGQVIFGEGLLAYRWQAHGILDAEELLASLRAAYEARPDLWQAWSALVSQLVDMNHLSHALELARRAVERFPLLSRLWVDLARVYQCLGNRHGEIDALEHALEINPSWGLALRKLADVYERAGEFEKSRALLEQALKRDPRDAFTHGCLADTLWKLGNKQEALSRMRQAVELDPGYRWAWDMLHGWALELEQPELPAQLARELTQRRPGEARSWLLLADMLERPQGIAEGLEALGRAIELSPRCVEAHYSRAVLLAEAHRYEEALAATSAESWEGPLPAELRSCHACILAQQGELNPAITLMRELVDEDPQYAYGWRKLVEWYEVLEDKPSSLEAARVLVRLEPQNHVAHGCLADALRMTGEREQAKTHFSRALAIAPDYSFAGMSLFDMQIEDDELKAAQKTLALLQTHVGGAFVLARAVQMDVRNKQPEQAAAHVRELFMHPGELTWPLQWAAQAMNQGGYGQKLDELLEQAVADPQTNSLVGRVWMGRCLSKYSVRECSRRLERVENLSAAGNHALGTYLEGLADRKRWWRFGREVKKRQEKLRANTRCWAAVGYGLVTFSRYRKAVRWLADWQERRDAEPWMMLNVSLAYRNRGDWEQARRVNLHALELGEDHTSIRHVVWLTLDAVLCSASFEAGHNYWPLVRSAELPPYDTFVRLLIEAVGAAQGAEPGQGSNGFARARYLLGEAKGLFPRYQEDRVLADSYYRTVQIVAKARGGVVGLLWGRSICPLFWRWKKARG